MTRTLALALLLSALVAGMLLTWYSARQEREYRRLIAVGDAALARDQTFVAIEAYSGAAAIQPNSMLAYLKRGDTYRRQGELTSALRDLRQASRLDPMSTRTLELLGDVNVALGRLEQGTQDYARFVSLDDRSPRVLYKLALTHYKRRQPGASIEPLRQAVAMEERFSEAHHLLGLCLRERKRTDEAVGALRRAVDVNPAFTAARADLATLYGELGRNRESLEQLEALAAIEPSRAERLVAVALAYSRLGRTDAAITTLARAAERHPDDPAVFNGVGRVWLESAESRGDRVALSKALEAFQASAASGTPTSEALALHGRALFLSGDTDAGLRALTEATTTLPVDPSAFVWLSAAAQRRGNADVARLALASYASLVPEESPGTTAARVAESLRLQQRLRFTGAGSSQGRGRPATRLPGN
jgi:tetratricopeptide (TPR) repeat protein